MRIKVAFVKKRKKRRTRIYSATSFRESLINMPSRVEVRRPDPESTKHATKWLIYVSSWILSSDEINDDARNRILIAPVPTCFSDRKKKTFREILIDRGLKKFFCIPRERKDNSHAYIPKCVALLFMATLAAMSDHQDAAMVHGLDPKSDGRESQATDYRRLIKSCVASSRWLFAHGHFSQRDCFAT